MSIVPVHPEAVRDNNQAMLMLGDIAVSALYVVLTCLVLEAGGQYILIAVALLRCLYFFVKWVEGDDVVQWQATSFGYLDLHTRSNLMHEGSHALAARGLFRDAHPTISYGMTHWNALEPTSLGRYLGFRNSIAFVAAAGTLGAVGFALLEMIIAHFVGEDHPHLAAFLNASAFFSILDHAVYAVSALFIPGPNHDFCILWELLGIHPLFFAAGLILIPLLIQLGLAFLEGNTWDVENPALWTMTLIHLGLATLAFATAYLLRK